ncbi:MAG: hypothetical protein GWO24_00170, partial [Akkermansiaceae bacterium]|nr:hypothetical protein [Akkermansiaceae bacterium]
NGLGPLSRGLEKPKPSVVVGNDMIRAFETFQLDYPGRTLRLAATTRYTPRKDALMTTLAAGYAHGALTVDGAINGRPAPIVLDSAGDYAVVV